MCAGRHSKDLPIVVRDLRDLPGTVHVDVCCTGGQLDIEVRLDSGATQGAAPGRIPFRQRREESDSKQKEHKDPGCEFAHGASLTYVAIPYNGASPKGLTGLRSTGLEAAAIARSCFPLQELTTTLSAPSGD